MATAANTENEARPGGLGTVLRVRIELWLVVAFMALSFGAGVIVTAVARPAQTSNVPAVGQTTTGGFVAPPLTQQQLSGTLPSGHPNITGDGSGTGSGAGSGSGKSGSGTGSSPGASSQP